MKWREEYLIGIKEIDEQHKKLIEISELLSYSTNINEINDILLFLDEYIVFHFKTEEDLMERNNYAFLAEHRELHKELLEKIEGYIELYFLGNYSFLGELEELVLDWVSTHILVEDKKYMDFFKDKDILF